jgi:hypothetical protein
LFMGIMCYISLQGVWQNSCTGRLIYVICLLSAKVVKHCLQLGNNCKLRQTSVAFEKYFSSKALVYTSWNSLKKLCLTCSRMNWFFISREWYIQFINDGWNAPFAVSGPPCRCCQGCLPVDDGKRGRCPRSMRGVECNLVSMLVVWAENLIFYVTEVFYLSLVNLIGVGLPYCSTTISLLPIFLLQSLHCDLFLMWTICSRKVSWEDHIYCWLPIGYTHPYTTIYALI